jgi:membrane protease YdiL (CAAX protease family)
MGDAVAGWVLAQIGGVLAGSVVLVLAGVEEFDDLSLGWMAVAQIGLWAGFLGVPWFVSWTKGSGLVSDFGLRARWRDFPVGAGLGLLSQLVLVPLVYLPLLELTNTSIDELSEPARELSDRATNGFGVAMLILIVGIGAPIFEEVFYRGLVLRSVERRFGTRAAVVVSSLVFGLSHFQPLQTAGLVVFGLVLAVLTVRSGRLGPAIAAHVTFNMVTVVALLATQSGGAP